MEIKGRDSTGPQREAPTPGSVFPRRPRFLRELVVVPHAGELLVDGMEQLQVLRGEAAVKLMPGLIALMDGNRTVRQLEAALPGVRPDHIRAAIVMLMGNGLLEEGTDDPVPKSDTLGFFRRFSAVTRRNSSGYVAYGKLREAHVTVIAADRDLPRLELLRPALIDTGIGEVSLINRDSLRTLTRPKAPAPSMLVSLSLAGDDYDWHAGFDEWCYRQGFSWLRAVVDEKLSYADLGPLFNRAEAPCFTCFQNLHGRLPSALPAPHDTTCAAEFWMSMAAVEIIYLLSGIGPAVTQRGLRRFDLAGWQSKDLRCFRIPGCSRCRALPDTADASNQAVRAFIDVAVAFEDFAGLSSRDAIDPRADQESSRIGASLSVQTKQLPTCEQYPLPPAILDLKVGVLDALNRDFRASSQRLKIEHIATILKLTAGIRELPLVAGKVQRWAASGGNLGSVELYVAARRVEGLPAGIYFYQPQEHALALLKRRVGGLNLDDFVRRATPRHEALPDALVIFTGSFHRVSRKYGPFGYRLIQMDAGAGVSQLHVVAQSLGIRSQTAATWADDLIEDQLDLNPLDEQVTSAAGLWSAGAFETGESSRHIEERRGSPNSLKPAREFYEASLSNTLEKLYRESRNSERESLLGPYAVPPGLALGEWPKASRSVSLPSPHRGGSRVGVVLEERITIRRYSERAVSLNQIATALHYAVQGDIADWPEEQRDHQALRFLVLATRVEGLDSGAWIYDAEHNGLKALRPALAAGEVSELFVQSEFVSAPVHFWVLGNLAAVCARHGAWGHRNLLLRAGVAAHRLWFGAIGTGLGGAIVAGLVPGAARLHLGLDGYKSAGLIGVASGFNRIA